MPSLHCTKRLLLLAGKLGYQTASFAEAARRLGADVLFGTDRCHRLDDPWGDAAIPLDFGDPDGAAEAIARVAARTPIDAVLALGDRPVPAAARAASRLGLAFHPVDAVENCRTKLRQREALRAAGLPVPDFFVLPLDAGFEQAAQRAMFPCVLKPLALAASQGVIRADDPAGFREAARRIRALVQSPPVQVERGREPGELDRLLVERYIPGREVAVEAVVSGGRLRLLALFDKPDPLEGPFFEETIYVTPSRLPEEEQNAIRACAERSVAALGLTHGPVHAEFRVNERGPWVLEIQPRPIGGLCARALRFGPEGMSLEELLARSALGLPGADREREEAASGVMMIPVPRSGIFEGVEGLPEALAVPSVQGIEITARRRDPVLAWPEGSSYLGFIFARGAGARGAGARSAGARSAEARGAAPAGVERALRAAHAKLRFVFSSELPVEHPAAPR